MKNIIVWFKKFIHFVTVDIWRIPLDELPKSRSILFRQIRIIALAIKGFTEDRIQLKASALTLYSLLSVVPVVAMFFVIAKGFGFKERIQAELVKTLQGHEEVLNWIMDFANKLLENVNSGFLTGIGIVILLWSVMSILGNIESAFNGIWQIRKPRPFFRKFSDYLAMMLVSPVLIILSSSVTVFITGQLNKFSELYPVLENLKFFVKLSPYFLVWILFILLYMVMPNTKVKFRSALIGAIIAGSIFQLTQWGYIHFQIGVSRYSAIYGSFAALPLFLIWLQLSWLIVLLGAEISFANQNVSQYEFEFDSLHISIRLKRLMTLLIVNRVVKNFANGEKALTASQISDELKIPVRLVREIIYELTEINIFVELTSDNPRERYFQPAVDINQITVRMVLDRLEEKGSDHISPLKGKEYKGINEVLESYRKMMAESDKNLLVKDI